MDLWAGSLAFHMATKEPHVLRRQNGGLEEAQKLLWHQTDQAGKPLFSPSLPIPLQGKRRQRNPAFFLVADLARRSQSAWAGSSVSFWGCGPPTWPHSLVLCLEDPVDSVASTLISTFQVHSSKLHSPFPARHLSQNHRQDCDPNLCLLGKTPASKDSKRELQDYINDRGVDCRMLVSITASQHWGFSVDLKMSLILKPFVGMSPLS